MNQDVLDLIREIEVEHQKHAVGKLICILEIGTSGWWSLDYIINKGNPLHNPPAVYARVQLASGHTLGTLKPRLESELEAVKQYKSTASHLKFDRFMAEISRRRETGVPFDGMELSMEDADSLLVHVRGNMGNSAISLEDISSLVCTTVRINYDLPAHHYAFYTEQS